jgi:hypothetical protein
VEYSPVTVVETESFQRKVGRLLSENEKDQLIAYLSIHPNVGILIKGREKYFVQDGKRTR